MSLDTAKLFLKEDVGFDRLEKVDSLAFWIASSPDLESTLRQFFGTETFFGNFSTFVLRNGSVDSVAIPELPNIAERDKVTKLAGSNHPKYSGLNLKLIDKNLEHLIFTRDFFGNSSFEELWSWANRLKAHRFPEAVLSVDHYKSSGMAYPNLFDIQLRHDGLYLEIRGPKLAGSVKLATIAFNLSQNDFKQFNDSILAYEAWVNNYESGLMSKKAHTNRKDWKERKVKDIPGDEPVRRRYLAQVLQGNVNWDKFEGYLSQQHSTSYDERGCYSLLQIINTTRFGTGMVVGIERNVNVAFPQEKRVITLAHYK